MCTVALHTKLLVSDTLFSYLSTLVFPFAIPNQLGEMCTSLLSHCSPHFNLIPHLLADRLQNILCINI